MIRLSLARGWRTGLPRLVLLLQAVAAAHAGAVGRGFRAVARYRKFLIVIAVNIVLIIVGYTLFSNILPPFAIAHTRAGRLRSSASCRRR